MSAILFFVRFPGGGIYATGQQGSIPGGPVAYESQDDAKAMAKAIEGGYYTHRALEDAIEFCQAKGYTLWIRKAGGGMCYVANASLRPRQVGSLERVEGDERERLIDQAQRLGNEPDDAMV